MLINRELHGADLVAHQERREELTAAEQPDLVVDRGAPYGVRSVVHIWRRIRQPCGVLCQTTMYFPWSAV